MKTNLLKSFYTSVLFLSSTVFAFSQSPVTFNGGASGTFIVPCGINSITVQVWGGGGAGGGDRTNGGVGGSGGGAGGYSTATLAVTPGQSYTYSVGSGGVGTNGNPATGPDGGQSFFRNAGLTVNLIANGGRGGAANAANAAPQGEGGTASGGTTNTSGGNATSSVGTSGGAGGSASNGGTGGAGGADQGNGADAQAGQPGGGGGGSGDKFLSNLAGGDGGSGKIVITYTVTSAGVDQTLVACATTATMAATVPSAGTGTWTCVTNCGGVGITTPTSATTGITGLTAGTNTTLRWTISNAGCTSTTDDVIINTAVTASVDAGPDQTLAACETTGTLAAVAIPNGGTGTWTCVTNCGGVVITSPNSPTSTFSGLTVPNATTFRWTGCTRTDDVIISTVSGPLCPVYCAEGTMNCASFGDGLTNVTFSTINANSATCANGTAACAIVTAGNTYSFSATSGASTGNHSLAVYTDWNSDGDFSDAGEFTLIANNNMQPNTTRSGNITVPAGATCDATIRMRVVYVYSTPVPTAANGCSNFTYGETEDYCLTISCCVPNCSNGVQDCNELGIDCGGPCGSACAGVVSCTNAILDGEETSIDCGGPVCNPCGAQCSTFSNATSNPVIADDGSTIIDASAGDQTITTCVEVTYSNRGTNWLHGVFMNPGSTGFVSTAASGAQPEPNSSSIGTVYTWKNQTTNFTGQTSGNSITQNGWFVGTGNNAAAAAADDNPGNNLGWPVGAGTTFGPFCFTTVVGCSGLSGDNAAFMNFQTTGDSYSGSWSNVDCGKESSFGENAFVYTLRCPVGLPIELLSFNGVYEGRKVLLKWSTATEHDNDFFTVLRSTDGIKFEDLAKVEGAPNGSSITKRDYSLYDYNPENPITYYKIRQTDFDGTKKESSVVAILSPKVFDDLTVVPNPVSNIASLTYYAENAELTQFKIYDLSGKIMFQNQVESDKGVNSVSFDTENYNSGLYFVEIVTNNEPKKIKFTVQK